MRIYIVEDDLAIINILEDIIETQDLGEICGDCGGEPADVLEVLRSKPDLVLVDFFINKPINLIEVTSVIKTVERQIENERTINNIRQMFS